MRIIITSCLLFAFLSCKKENKTSADQITAQADTTTVKNDTLTAKAPTQEQFNFVTELCDNKGYFDSSKYSREEIEGTYKLWFELGGSLLNTPSVFKLKDLEEVRHNKDQLLAALERDFIEKKNLFQNLKIVNKPFWQNVKKVQYEALVQRYEMEKIRIAAYSDPSILLKTNQCQSFAKALNSTDEEMVTVWRKLREESSKNNADPARIMNEFNDHLNSPDKRDYATIDLITFGWGNCANDKIKRVNYDEKMNKEFYSLFIKTDSECDEP
ncbi:hypothetical protein [Chryseobacterium pennipullorum]|uniref:Uncharacterized protein n=1 Tax=Chryseobacterium pennipullorum TaxID=2258963 RepID=A0A3D9B0L5_9FLAO|nr:hypothetical protein [Chryseobacterium pennipullorum]REC47059.1 hypothetical protein DRF67_12655 [Chryseobacterium pennipullorum]